MKVLFYILTILGGLLGAFILVAVLFSADSSAPQQGAAAAVAAAICVIPYCMARAIEKMRQKPLEESLHKLLMAQQQRGDNQS